MITINFFATLRLFLQLKEIQIDAVREAPVRDVLRKVEDLVFERTGKKFIGKFVNDKGHLQHGTMILINGKNVLDADGLDALVKDGDTVALFPQAGGG